MTLSNRKMGNNKRALIAYSYPESIISEQYRMIEANIKFSMENQRSRSFLITSPGSSEGKSTNAGNLAVTMAQKSKKVLLIDANLRNPVLHYLFKVPNTKGLADILTGQSTFEEAVNRTEIGSLDILTAGQISINLIELLSSHKMHEILKESFESYDIVLIDSHSILELTDTKLLASQCDGVVLVVKKGKTLLKNAEESRKVLEFSKAKLIGVILNE